MWRAVCSENCKHGSEGGPREILREPRGLPYTDNRDLNQLICERWAEVVGRKHVFRWSPDSARQEHLIGGLGQPIWNNLPKPTQIEYTLRNKDAVIAKANLKKLPPK